MATTDSPLAAALPRSLAARGAVAAVLAVLVNDLVVLGTDALNVAPGFQPLSFSRVTFLSAVGVVGATLVFAGLRRYVDRPERTFVWLAAGVLVLSFLPDLALLENDPAATVPGVVVLMVMHVVVAALSVGILVAGGGAEPAGEPPDPPPVA